VATVDLPEFDRAVQRMRDHLAAALGEIEAAYDVLRLAGVSLDDDQPGVSLPHPATPGDPIVHVAVQTLRSFGDIHRETAAKLLASWYRDAELSEQQRQAILAQFPQREYPTRGPLGEGNSGPGGAL
jgi:hypothetical protein